VEKKPTTERFPELAQAISTCYNATRWRELGNRVFQLAENRHTAGRSDHARRWQQKTSGPKVSLRRRCWSAGWLAGGPAIRDNFARLLRFSIRHRSSQRYSRDLTCATDKSYTIDFCDGMDTCGVRFGTLLARMLLAMPLWENCGSVCGKRGFGRKGGKGRALRRVSMNICRW
jgi:hypothetical protein